MTLGAVDMISVVVRSSLIQLSTPDDMRGRVGAVNAMFIGTSNQLGEFESGVGRRVVRDGGLGGAGWHRHPDSRRARACGRFRSSREIDRLDLIRASPASQPSAGSNPVRAHHDS